MPVRNAHPPVGTSSTTVAPSQFYMVLGNLVFVLTLVGYPLSAALTQFLGLVSSDINFAFRIIHIALALLLLSLTFARKAFSFDWLIGLFFALYMVRLWSDLSYSLLPNTARDFQFFLATTLVPVIAMAGGQAWFDERTALKLTISAGGIAGVLIIYNLTLGPIVALAPDPNQRASLELLNPISIGYHGLFIASAALILLARYRSLITILLATPVAILGGYLLIVSGSRGPFVALLIALIVTGMANTRANVAYVIVGILAATLLTYFGAPEVVLNRFLTTGQDASSIDRVYTLDLAIDQALQNPIFGYAYIEPITGSYPHNLLVEAGLALGVVGAALMLWMQILLLWNAWKAARTGAWFIPLLGGMTFANAWISGSLWGSGLFFAILWLLRDFKGPTRSSATKIPQSSRLVAVR